MKRDFRDYIEDIIDAMSNAERFIEGMKYVDFIEDKKTIYAVIRCLEITGEAVKKIPDDIRRKYPEIPWKEIAGMRDKLIHDYLNVDFEILWETIKKDIPDLKLVFDEIKEDF